MWPDFAGRGQESAPLELLVAVIVMMLVLTIGFQALQIANEEQCKARVDSALKDFKIRMETAVSSHTPARVFFDLPAGCWEKPRVTMRIVADDLACSTFCGGARRDCVLLNFFAGNYGDTVCVNIPPITSFPDHASVYDPDNPTSGVGKCPDRARSGREKDPVPMIPVNFYNSGVCPGQYELIDRTPVAGSAFPVVCAYKACSDLGDESGFGKCEEDKRPECLQDCWACQ